VAADVSEMHAFQALVYADQTVVSALYGGQFYAQNQVAGAVGIAMGFDARVLNANAGGSITAAYGARLQVIVSAGSIGTGYILYGAVQGAPTVNWGLYITGTAQHYLVGNVGIGTATFGNNMTSGIQIASGTDPDGNVVDTIAFYATDIVAGNCGPAFRTENGTVIRLDQSLLTSDSPSFAGFTKIGDATNYMSVAADGEITLAGTARVKKMIDMAGGTLEFGSTAPAAVSFGIYLAWSYDIGDDSALVFELPHDWASGTDLEVYVDWVINRDYATENGEVQWNVTWNAVPHDASEVITGAGTTLDPGDQNIPANANTLTRTTMGTIAGASLSAEDEIALYITRVAIDDGNDPGGAVDPAITHILVEYTADKLGEAT
jgi:hypothetical protein